MYQGKTNRKANVYDNTSTKQQVISNIPEGATVQGDAPSGGYAYIYDGRVGNTAWKHGFVKTSQLTGYAQVVTPPPPPPPTDATLVWTIDYYSDQHIEVTEAATGNVTRLG